MFRNNLLKICAANNKKEGKHAALPLSFVLYFNHSVLRSPQCTHLFHFLPSYEFSWLRHSSITLCGFQINLSVWFTVLHILFYLYHVHNNIMMYKNKKTKTVYANSTYCSASCINLVWLAVQRTIYSCEQEPTHCNMCSCITRTMMVK